jgi:transposase
MTILAIDLAMDKSVACIFNTEDGGHRFVTFRTLPQQIHDLVVEVSPDCVVIEICAMAGWIHDLVRSLDVEIKVANPTNEAWKWKHIKRKTDRDDALKLAQLTALGQLPEVYMPGREVRQWRQLINYRYRLVCRQTAIKNSIRALLKVECIKLPSGKGGWTKQSLDYLHSLASSGDSDDLWRFQLGQELRCLSDVQSVLKTVTRKLDALAETCSPVQLLKTAAGVGTRLAETIVAYIDDPDRFDNGKQVGCYAGLTPRQFQSGTMDRRGRISKKGNGLLRAMLIQASWQSLRYNPYFREMYVRISGTSNTNRKKAIVAVARHLLVCCWAMWRDNEPWRKPQVSA